MSIHSVNTSCARAGVIMPSRYSLAKGASRNSASASAVLILHFPLELGSVKRFGLAALLTLNQGRPQGFELAMLAGLVRPDHIEHIRAVVAMGFARTYFLCAPKLDQST